MTPTLLFTRQFPDKSQGLIGGQKFALIDEIGELRTLMDTTTKLLDDLSKSFSTYLFQNDPILKYMKEIK